MTFWKRLFGDENLGALRAAEPIVPAVNALEGGMKALSDEALKGKTAEVRRRRGEGVPGGGGGGSGPYARSAVFRRSTYRRHDTPPGRYSRDAHGRRQDPGRDASGVPQRTYGQRGTYRHRQ